MELQFLSYVTTRERILIPPEWSRVILVQLEYFPEHGEDGFREKAELRFSISDQMASDETQSWLSFGQTTAWEESESWVCG